MSVVFERRHGVPFVRTERVGNVFIDRVDGCDAAIVKGFFSKTDNDLLNLQMSPASEYCVSTHESSELFSEYYDIPVDDSLLRLLKRLFPHAKRFDDNPDNNDTNAVKCISRCTIRKGIICAQYMAHVDSSERDFTIKRRFTIIVHLGDHYQMSTGYFNYTVEECKSNLNPPVTDAYYDNKMEFGDFTIHENESVCHTQPHETDTERKILLIVVAVQPTMTLDVILNGIRNYC